MDQATVLVTQCFKFVSEKVSVIAVVAAHVWFVVDFDFVHAVLCVVQVGAVGGEVAVLVVVFFDSCII